MSLLCPPGAHYIRVLAAPPPAPPPVLCMSPAWPAPRIPPAPRWRLPHPLLSWVPVCPLIGMLGPPGYRRGQWKGILPCRSPRPRREGCGLGRKCYVCQTPHTQAGTVLTAQPQLLPQGQVPERSSAPTDGVA